MSVSVISSALIVELYGFIVAGPQWEFAAGADLTECRCAIHTKVDCGVPGGWGCQGSSPGTVGPIAVLYRPGGHTHCGVEPGCRVNDGKLYGMVVSHVARNFRAMFLDVYLPQRWHRLGNSAVAAVDCFGAGYCYLATIRDGFRYRVARGLGPLPLLIHFARFFYVLGRPAMGKMSLATKWVDGVMICHVIDQGGEETAKNTQGFLFDLVEALKEGGMTARVGFLEIDDFICDLRHGGVDVDGVLPDDWDVVMHTSADQPNGDSRRRLRVLSVLGERAMKVVVARRALEAGLDTSDIAEMELKLTREAREAAFYKIGMDQHLILARGQGLSTLVCSTALSALIGAMTVNGSAVSIDRFMIHAGLV